MAWLDAEGNVDWQASASEAQECSCSAPDYQDEHCPNHGLNHAVNGIDN